MRTTLVNCNRCKTEITESNKMPLGNKRQREFSKNPYVEVGAWLSGGHVDLCANCWKTSLEEALKEAVLEALYGPESR